MKQIPNIFTLMNLFFGSAAIAIASQAELFVQHSINDYNNAALEKLSTAALLIFVAALVDFLDGFVARMFNACSEMGKQLDSLADVVSFGVAPGVIIYQLIQLGLTKETGATGIAIYWMLPSFLLGCAAAYRLAKFNLDTTAADGFKGVPTPAAGLLIASLPLILQCDIEWINLNQWLLNRWVLYSLIFVLSSLMVCNLPMMSLKFKDASLKKNTPRIVLLLISILTIPFIKWLAIPFIFGTYILLSLLLKRKQQTSYVN